MNEVMNSVNNVIMDNFHKTDNILNDVQTIIEVSQKRSLSFSKYNIITKKLVDWISNSSGRISWRRTG